MNEEQKEALKEIEDQLYAINARNISMRWIGLRQKPTDEEISELNALLGFLIQEMRTLRETGKLDVKKVHKQVFEKNNAAIIGDEDLRDFWRNLKPDQYAFIESTVAILLSEPRPTHLPKELEEYTYKNIIRETVIKTFYIFSKRKT